MVLFGEASVCGRQSTLTSIGKPPHLVKEKKFGGTARLGRSEDLQIAQVRRSGIVISMVRI